MIQALTTADVPATIELLRRTGLEGATANFTRYRRWQPDGAWGLFDNGALVGSVTLLRFGRVGFVGCMAVEPALQAQGRGRALLEHAHAAGRRAGVTTFLLEATAIGRRLYENLGYAVDHETWVGARKLATEPPGAVVEIGAARAEILALDRRATGSPRDMMIGDLIDHHHGGLERSADGAVVGYGLVVGDRLGPVIASDPGAGRALIERLAGGCAVVGVPMPNAPAIAAASAAGFAPARTLTRMRLGPPVDGDPAWCWALASPGAG
jgi:N-acetylglutamate synthase-like GNAT family acetyltransferase